MIKSNNQSCFIAHEVRNDPAPKKIKIPAFGKVTLIEDGDEIGKLERFEVFLDPSGLFATIEAVRKV